MRPRPRFSEAPGPFLRQRAPAAACGPGRWGVADGTGVAAGGRQPPARIQPAEKLRDGLHKSRGEGQRRVAIGRAHLSFERRLVARLERVRHLRDDAERGVAAHRGELLGMECGNLQVVVAGCNQHRDLDLKELLLRVVAHLRDDEGLHVRVEKRLELGVVGHVDPLSPLECPDYLHRFEVELHVRRNELPGQLQAEHLVERVAGAAE